MTDFQNTPNDNSNQNVIMTEATKKRVDVKKIVIVLMGIIILVLGYLLRRCVTTKIDDIIFDVEDDWELLEEATPTLTREQEYQMTQTKINEGGIRFEGGDGLSMEKAVVIVGAKNESEGIAAEYLYLNDKYGQKSHDYLLRAQKTLTEGDRIYDSLEIEVLALNQTLVYFFDITDFFGKW